MINNDNIFFSFSVLLSRKFLKISALQNSRESEAYREAGQNNFNSGEITLKTFITLIKRSHR